jgi:hypothetical protein
MRKGCSLAIKVVHKVTSNGQPICEKSKIQPWVDNLFSNKSLNLQPIALKRQSSDFILCLMRTVLSQSRTDSAG